MATLFRPVTVKPFPASAEKIRVNSTLCVRWKSRSGGWIVAQLTATGKARVKSPYWWIEYTDAHGVRQRVKASRNRKAAEHRMAQIVQQVERERGGLEPDTAQPATIPLWDLATEYTAHLEALGRSEVHYGKTGTQLGRVIAECGWMHVRDVSPERWARWTADMRAADYAPETINHYLRALRGFFRWMIRAKRLAADPLASVRLLNVATDRRIVRRALDPAQFAQLIVITKSCAKRRIGLSGPARAALYLTAARTGLRSITLAQLRPEDVRLDDPIPHVATTAASQKNRKAHLAPIPPDLLPVLREWIATRKAGALLWPGNWHTHCGAAGMLRADLKLAGIPVATADGVYDFHALRDQCGTDLARAGVPLTTVQAYLGHSSPVITAKYYIRLGLADLADAGKQLG